LELIPNYPLVILNLFSALLPNAAGIERKINVPILLRIRKLSSGIGMA
jgi:hypothetical protein